VEQRKSKKVSRHIIHSIRQGEETFISAPTAIGHKANLNLPLLPKKVRFN
jgi:hypothetical protein